LIRRMPKGEQRRIAQKVHRQISEIDHIRATTGPHAEMP
jgi:hypothetical protein